MEMIDIATSEYILKERLRPHVEAARNWWAHYDEFVFKDTGTVKGNGPNGFFIRTTRVAARSAIKGIQAFPFVPTTYLGIQGISGGVVSMIDNLLMNDTFTMDEFTIIEKSNLPATFNQKQILCIIPTELYKSRDIGLWLYFTKEELCMLAAGIVTDSVMQKVKLKV